MTEIQCYRRLYGNLVFLVPHYFKTVSIADDDRAMLVRHAHGKEYQLFKLHTDKTKFTLDDVPI